MKKRFTLHTLSPASKTRCCLCGKPTDDHLCLKGNVLCAACEKRILTETPGTPSYDALVRDLRDRFLTPASDAAAKNDSSGRKRRAACPTQTA